MPTPPLGAGRGVRWKPSFRLSDRRPMAPFDCAVDTSPLRLNGRYFFPFSHFRLRRFVDWYREFGHLYTLPGDRHEKGTVA